MKKIRLFLYSLFVFLLLSFSFFSLTKADFSGFIDQMRTMNIPVDQLLEQTKITRYELTRLLNAVECKDCINPDTLYTNKYTPDFWATFVDTPGKDFEDIKYQQAKYNKKSYYYCVAYVGDNQYMRGYPAETSPVCAGKFCGTRYTTKAEFLQVIINMMGKYLYPMFALNWKEVKNRLADVGTDSYEGKNFTEANIKTIKERAKECGDQSCILQSAAELKLYLLYCTFNLEACGMTPLGKIREGYWPIAELNMLYRQSIINVDEAAKYNVEQMIDGTLMIKILAGMNDIISCSFDNDYDCDGLVNSKDSCPYAYNPQQKDTDNDGIGDVCDDDIDNDGIKNPIGIVDDNGRVDISLWTGSMDNCLFIKNYEQTHTKSWIGDVCLSNTNALSLTIAIQKTTGTLPKTVSFAALNKGPVQSLSWDFGDGSLGSGQTTTHTYTSPGLYTVRLQAKGSTANDAFAKTTLIVGRDTSEKRALGILTQSPHINIGNSVTLSLSSIGSYDSFVWDFGDGTSETSTKTSLKKVYRSAGTYPVSVKALYQGKTMGVSLFTLSVGTNQSYGSVLRASVLNPDKNTQVSFTTDSYGFTLGDVRSISWNFGDGTSNQTDTLSTTHTYKISGKKAIIQTITLNNGVKINNIITLYIVSPRLFESYGLQYIPNPLDANTFKRITFPAEITPGYVDSFLFALYNYDDGNSDKISTTKNITFPHAKYHIYTTPGIYYPQTSITIDQCSLLSAQATLAVGGSDFCLQAKLDGSIAKYACDMDKDGTPDICDADMDGDGKANLLGIIDPDHYNQCDYISSLKNTDNKNKDSDLLNLQLLNNHFMGVCSLDNDPFDKNPAQTDANQNNIGDTLENALSGSNLDIITPEKDTDGDGLPDSQDTCPTLAENYDGIKDYDGCPEIGSDLNCENGAFNLGNIDAGNVNNGGIGGEGGGNGSGDSTPVNIDDIINTPLTLSNCLQCPCPYMDVSSALTNNDEIKAVLRDKQKKYPRAYSVGFPISY